MAIQGKLFGRIAELTVGPKNSGTNSLIEPSSFMVFKTRIKFDIEKDDGGTANKSKISIYNLNEDSRSFLEQDDMVVIFRTGYGTELSVLFFGDIPKNGVSTKRSGPDIITTIEADDAGDIMQKANIQIGLGPGATNKQLLNQAIAKLKLSIGPEIDFKTVTYKHGYTFSGKITTLLDVLSKQVGVKWAVNDGEISFLPPKKPEPGRVIKVTPATGLIGTPTKTKETFKFQTLLNGAIRPGKSVVVESKLALGDSGATVKIVKGKYSGDTHEGQWTGKFEGIIL